MGRYDLTTPFGRFKAHWSYFWKDHAFLRTAFTNAHSSLWSHGTRETLTRYLGDTL